MFLERVEGVLQIRGSRGSWIVDQRVRGLDMGFWRFGEAERGNLGGEKRDVSRWTWSVGQPGCVVALRGCG